MRDSIDAAISICRPGAYVITIFDIMISHFKGVFLLLAVSLKWVIKLLSINMDIKSLIFIQLILILLLSCGIDIGYTSAYYYFHNNRFNFYYHYYFNSYHVIIIFIIISNIKYSSHMQLRIVIVSFQNFADMEPANLYIWNHWWLVFHNVTLCCSVPIKMMSMNFIYIIDIAS